MAGHIDDARKGTPGGPAGSPARGTSRGLRYRLPRLPGPSALTAAAATLFLWSVALPLLPAFWLMPAGVLPYLFAPPLVAGAGGLLAAALLGATSPPSATAASLALLHLLLTLAFRRLEQQRRALERAATHDPLTGAGNRRALRHSLRAAHSLARRQRAAMALVMLDVDHFKAVNDRHGHLAGDRVLRRLATLCMSRLRSHDRLFRYGGEEFVVLLPFTGLTEARHVAESLRAVVARGTQATGVSVTLSAGVAELRPEESVTAWLARADAALRRAKRAGRDRTSARG